MDDNKELFVEMQEIDNVELKFLAIDDFGELKQAMIEAYKSMPNNYYWKEEHIQTLLDKFPEGQIAIMVNGILAGCALSLIVRSEEAMEDHTYQEITGNYSFNTHDEKGDVLYGIEIFIKPEFRGLRLGRRLYDYRKELCEKLNLKSIAFGGRIPNYHKYAEELTPKQYIGKVRRKEIHDPVLNFQLSNDFYPKKILKGYLKEDKASSEFAVLMNWDNIYYEKPSKQVSSKKTVVRLGLVQWQMRSYKNFEELMHQAEFFVDALSGYRSDFALFPELFNAPLMAENNHLSESQAIRELARYTDEIVQRFSELSISGMLPVIILMVLWKDMSKFISPQMNPGSGE